MQCSKLVVILWLTFLNVEAEAPPGYVKPLETPDKNPPKYEYGYNIEDDKGSSHGKSEARDGIHSLGRYYVKDKESSQNVQYFTDDWGYHPYVEYSNEGPESRSSARLILGTEAVKKFKNIKNAASPQQQVVESIDNINKKNRLDLEAKDRSDTVHESFNQAISHSRLSQILNKERVNQKTIHSHNTEQVVGNNNVQQGHLQQQQTFVQPQGIQHMYIYDQALQQPGHTLYLQQEVPTSNILGTLQPQQLILQQPQTIYYHQDLPLLNQNQLVFHHYDQSQQRNVQQHQSTVQQEAVTESVATAVTKQQLETSSHYDQSNLQSTQTLELSSKEIDESALNRQMQGNFGAKTTIKHVSVTASPVSSQDLIESVKELITGQDVVNLNEAINREDYKVETSTAAGYRKGATSGSNVVTKVEINQNNQVNDVTIQSSTEISLSKTPIVVEDVQETVKSSTEVNVGYSSTENSVSSISSSSVTEPSSVIVTPRPVSSNFLAPLTAGVRLQNIEYNANENVKDKEKFVVEIQKSVPYYLGKYEYQNRNSQKQNIEAATANYHKSVFENLELGKTLLYFPQNNNNNNKPVHTKAQQVAQQLPKYENKQRFNEIANTDFTSQKLPAIDFRAKFRTNDQTAQSYQQQQVTVQNNVPEKSNKIKTGDHPYPIEIPTTLQRLPEKPAEKPAEKPLPLQPFILEVPVPYPVVKQPFPVHVPLEHHHLQQPLEITLPIPVPQTYVLPVELPKPYPVDYPKYSPNGPVFAQPYVVTHPINVNQGHKQKAEQPVNIPIRYAERPQHSRVHPNYHYIHSYHPQGVQFRNKGYPRTPTDHYQHSGSLKHYHTIRPEDYASLPQANPWGVHPHHQPPQQLRRSRSYFNNLRIEYGFMPPLIPSLEIDEQGRPIEKGED